MLGLLMLCTAGALIGIPIFFAAFFTRRIESRMARAGVRAILVTMTVVGLIGDELIGKVQLEALCENSGISTADLSRARGKEVIAEVGGRVQISGTTLPAYVSRVSMRARDSSEVLF